MTMSTTCKGFITPITKPVDKSGYLIVLVNWADDTNTSCAVHFDVNSTRYSKMKEVKIMLKDLIRLRLKDNETIRLLDNESVILAFCKSEEEFKEWDKYMMEGGEFPERLGRMIFQ